MDRRLIEETFPIKEVSQNSSKEKEERRNNITTIHNWWARRPLSSSRATIFSSLIKNGYNEKIMHHLIDLSESKNISNFDLLKKSKKFILKYNKKPIKILDPFSGGGSIPLEALRLGCDVYANDYNPVSFLILKSILEFPKFFVNKQNSNGIVLSYDQTNLQTEITKWSKRVLELVKEELDEFYSSDDSPHVSSIWCRVIKCSNPACKADIPLFRNFWLSTKPKRKVAIQPIIKNKDITFRLVGTGYEKIPDNFDPSKGSISSGIAECFVCGKRLEKKEVREQFISKNNDERLVVIIYDPKKRAGKNYRIANEEDFLKYKKAESYLEKKSIEINKEIGINATPDEEFPRNVMMVGEPIGSAQNYHFFEWGDLYNSRQKLTMITFSEKIRLVFTEMIEENYDKKKAIAITTYLALIHSKLADWNNSLTVWLSYMEKQGHTFTRPALSFTWDYCENNPLEKTSGSWIITTDVVMGSLKIIPKVAENVELFNTSASSLEFSDGFFDAVITDPPYYSNIPYSYLSDFFYVWLKRTLKGIYPELFSTLLSPKADEIVAYSAKKDGKEIGNTIFEEKLSNALKEIYRVLKQEGIAVIVYAHKTTEGWETLINSLLDSGLIVTAAWPIKTEMKMRMTSHDVAALSSSIYIVCRKLEKQPHETYGNVKKQMKEYLDEKLDFLWEQDIRGADFFIAAIGSAIEVFGKYEQITDTSDKEIKVPQLLDDVRKLVSEYTINKVLHGEIGGEISTMTRFYVLWRAAYGQAKVPYDDARKLATSLGVNLEQVWNKGFIRKEKDIVRVLGPEDRSIEDIKEPTEMIDVLHKVLILWRNGKKDEYEKLLDEAKYAKSDTFRRVGQAISESLPDTQEKKMLDGFLNQYSSGESVSNDKQTKLEFE